MRAKRTLCRCHDGYLSIRWQFKRRGTSEETLHMRLRRKGNVESGVITMAKAESWLFRVLVEEPFWRPSWRNANTSEMET